MTEKHSHESLFSAAERGGGRGGGEAEVKMEDRRFQPESLEKSWSLINIFTFFFKPGRWGNWGALLPCLPLWNYFSHRIMFIIWLYPLHCFMFSMLFVFLFLHNLNHCNSPRFSHPTHLYSLTSQQQLLFFSWRSFAPFITSSCTSADNCNFRI